MKIKIIQIDIALLCLTFYEITMLPHAIFLGFKYAVLTYLLLKYAATANRIPFAIIPAALYGASNVFSTVYNHMDHNVIIASIFYMIQIVVIFLVTENFLSKFTLELYATTIFAVIAVLLAITDALMLVMPYNFSDPNQFYFIGNKFVVSYLHCFAAMLLFIISYKSKKTWEISRGILRINGLSLRAGAFAFSVFSVFICRKVTCSTGMLVCALLIVIMLIPAVARPFFSNGKMMIIVTAVLNFFLLGSYSFLNTSFVHEFIYGVLDKSVTWNGRLIIWNDVFRLIGKKLVFGYGYYSSIVFREIGFGNPQNAVLKFLIDTGIVGLVLYGVVVWVCFRAFSSEALKRIYPTVAFMYVMIFAALVEINLTHMILFMAMAIAFSGARHVDRRLKA